MPSNNSPMQDEARHQALLLLKDIRDYEHLYGYNDFLKNQPSIHDIRGPSIIRCPDAWDVSHQTLEGDFALDDVLAREVALRAVSNLLGGEWLNDYLDYKPGENAGFNEYLKDAAAGPGNIVGNANQARGAAEAVLSSKKIADATKLIEGKKVQSVKLNNHMTLYNANSGKGAPRLRIRISGLRAKVVTPIIDPGKLRMYGRERLSFRARDLKNMGGIAGMTSKTRLLNTRAAGGVLTFAPTLAIDLFNNFSGKNCNYRQFVSDEFRNQSGNLAAFMAGAVVIGFATSATAPVIIFALIAGIAVQVIWNSLGMSDEAARLGENIADNWPYVDFRNISP